MRPRRLVMDGFLAYRQRTEVDFTDADLFVLSGPTGAGKSSVIDGMIFALYGTIPRLDDRRSVAPVISAQADRAKVAFEFTVGEEEFTAARLVERTKSGATTSEASLERGQDREVLARGADEVTARVIELLGLSYDQFTKAVVLPQGAFADFLTDKPSDRQALLRALLDIGLFERVMQLANARAKTSEGRAQAIEESLAKLDVPTAEQIDEARSRLAALAEARDHLPAKVADLERLVAAVAEATAARAETDQSLQRLESITLPEDLETLDRDRLEGSTRLEALSDSTSQLKAARDEVDQAVSTQPPLAQLESWRANRAQLEKLAADRAALDLDALGADLAEATSARDRGVTDLNTLRVAHAAHVVREGLVPGEPCPVCLIVVGEVPEEGGGPTESMDLLTKELAGLESRAAEARDRLKGAEGEAKGLDRRVAEVEALLAGAAAPDLVESAIVALEELAERRAGIDEDLERVHLETEDARARLAELSARASSLFEALLSARDLLAAEKPPIPGDDPVQAWQSFESWRVGEVERRRSDLVKMGEAVATAQAEADQASAAMRAWLESLGIEVTGSPEAHLALAEERRRTEIEELEKSIAEAADLGQQLEAESSRARVAASLGTHLKSNNFEAWLLEEAMETLVDGANLLLRELTGGAYSLMAHKSQFEVIDHRNADLRRTTKGLSGGETFLVALSLSLSMAQQLAELTGTSSRLECVLLDEGFGSLDQESIDIVASVLDELASGGRTVGIVTHVQELSERIPIRFQVTKSAETSSVERMAS